MAPQEFLSIFLASLAALYPAMLLFYYILVSRTRLEAKGYSAEYIDFLRRDRRQRLIGIAVAIPLLELAAAGIVVLLTGPLRSEEQLLYMFVAFLILVLPFPIRDRYVTQKRMKELARRGGESIVVDLKHEVLHRVFRPSWELLFLAAYVALWQTVSVGFHVSFIHLVILWLLYLTARGTKNANRPALREAYLWSLTFMMLNHLILLYYLVDLLRCCLADFSSLQAYAAAALLILFAAKTAYYIAQTPSFSRELRGRT